MATMILDCNQLNNNRSYSLTTPSLDTELSKRKNQSKNKTSIDDQDVHRSYLANENLCASRIKLYISIILVFASVNLTETNIQIIQKSNYDDEHKHFSDLNSSLNRRILNGTIQMNIASIRDETNHKFKVSPTRIRFSSAKSGTVNLPIDNTERSSGSQDKMLDHDAVLSFADKRSKTAKQMAPAYELWPDLKDNVNQLVAVREYPSYPPATNHQQQHHKETRLVSNSPNYSISTNVNLKYLRNLLPKPMSLLSSSTNGRVVRIRSAPAEQSSSTSENKRGQSGSEDYESEPDSDSQSGTEEGETESTPDVKINFKVYGDEQLVYKELPERRRLKESAIYPPGDLDRLYSDALLVYVKDFNQYIK